MQRIKWVIDPSHSYIEFSIFMNGEAPRKVYFRKMMASLLLEEEFDKSQIQLQWIADSIDSGDKGMDKFLSSADFFASEKVPLLKFTSEKISKISHSQYGVRGCLTYGSHDEPISFNAKFENNIVDQEDGSKRTGLYMSTQVDPKMFDIGSREIKFDKSIGIELELEFLRKS